MVICFSPCGNRKSFSRAEDKTIKKKPPETVTKNKRMTIFTTKLKKGLMVSSLGEIRYQRRNTKRIKTTKLKMDKKRNPHFFFVKTFLITFSPLIIHKTFAFFDKSRVAPPLAGHQSMKLWLREKTIISRRVTYLIDLADK